VGCQQHDPAALPLATPDIHNTGLTLISGFHRNVDDIYALLRYYVASCGNFFTDVSGQRIGPIFKGQEYIEELLSNFSAS
jgi:hypothetical protein